MPNHVRQELRESAEFANARLDALRANLSVAFGKGNREVEEFFFRAMQEVDKELVSKWPAIQQAIRERES